MDFTFTEKTPAASAHRPRLCDSLCCIWADAMSSVAEQSIRFTCTSKTARYGSAASIRGKNGSIATSRGAGAILFTDRPFVRPASSHAVKAALIHRALWAKGWRPGHIEDGAIVFDVEARRRKPAACPEPRCGLVNSGGLFVSTVHSRW
jgi:hypothetical protein